MTGTFTVSDWDEQPLADRPIGKLTRATVTATLSGGIDGTGTVTWLMCYGEDGTAEYVGFLDIDGTVDGRTGGFVVRTSGTFDGQKAVGPWKIVEGSGRDGLAGIAGSGAFDSPHGTQATYRLAIRFGDAAGGRS